MSVYKALGAAVRKQGVMQLPDGKTYTVTALTMGEILDIEAAQSDDVSEVEAMRVIAAIAARCTGADISVIRMMDPTEVGHLIACARIGVEAVMVALAAEAAASGNVPAPATTTATQPRRSTSRSKL